uniref:G-protein coupled receptors family 1 profile domain-containing protein n=1 Tax=Anopheles merus TaxID=30066 RepID=A0A182UT32_ANOME
MTSNIKFKYHDREIETCGFLEKDSPSWAAFHIAFFLSSYVVPLILISVLYMWMLSRLWRSSVGGRSAKSKKGKKRVTRLVVIVVAAFASLWFPIQSVVSVAGGTGVDRHSSAQGHLFTILTTTTVIIITLLRDTFSTLADSQSKHTAETHWWDPMFNL